MPKSFQDADHVLAGKRFDVYRVELPRCDGQPVAREVCVPSDAVVIMPLIDEKTVVMILNERFAVGETLWELPAGTLEPDEPVAQCAGRELIEETGYRAGRIEPLTEFYTTPGICTERMHAFVARDLTHVGQNLDDTERITVEVMALDRSMQMMQDGTIRDGKTIATLLYYHKFTRRLD